VVGGGIVGAAGVIVAAGSIGATVDVFGVRRGVAIGGATWIAGGSTAESDDAGMLVTDGVVDVSGGDGTGTVAGGWIVGDADR
jgi:hypothetical protein